MSFIDKWIQKRIDKALRKQKAAPIYQQGIRYAINNGRITGPADNQQTFIRDGYSINDIIYAIVNIILDKVRLPEWGLYKVVDESSLKKSRAILERKDLNWMERKKALEQKYDSLEPIDTPNLQQGKLADLLKYPNERYDFQMLVAEAAMFNLLTGNVYWLGEVLSSGANEGIPNTIWTLPSQFMTISSTMDFPTRITQYILNDWSKKYTPEQVMHQKRENPNYSTSGAELYGLSPLKAALKNLTRNNSAKDAATAKFQNGGLEEIIFLDDQRFTPEQGKQQIQAIKTQLSENEYRGPDAQGKFAISGYPVGKVGLGLSPVELAIIESEKWDAVMFCNIYGVPPELLGLVQKTYNNVKEAEKALTTRSALPLLSAIRGAFNRKLQTDWGFKGKNVYVDYDIECFTELQPDYQEVINMTSKMMMLTPNEERQAVNWETRPEPEADEVWVLQGGNRVPLTDYQQSVIDNQLMQDAITNGQANSANGNGQVPQNGQGNAGLPDRNGKNVQFAKSL